MSPGPVVKSAKQTLRSRITERGALEPEALENFTITYISFLKVITRYGRDGDIRYPRQRDRYKKIYIIQYLQCEVLV